MRRLRSVILPPEQFEAAVHHIGRAFQQSGDGFLDHPQRQLKPLGRRHPFVALQGFTT
jgi:hypothetical protein